MPGRRDRGHPCRLVYSNYIFVFIKDFQFGSVRSVVPPIAITYNPSMNRGVIFVRLASGKISEGINDIKGVVNKFYAGESYRTEFLDERFNNMYQEDRDFARNVGLFSGLAIFVSALGLFGSLPPVGSRPRNPSAMPVPWGE